jgi:hypothetical protein
VILLIHFSHSTNGPLQQLQSRDIQDLNLTINTEKYLSPNNCSYNTMLWNVPTRYPYYYPGYYPYYYPGYYNYYMPYWNWRRW